MGGHFFTIDYFFNLKGIQLPKNIMEFLHGIFFIIPIRTHFEPERRGSHRFKTGLHNNENRLYRFMVDYIDCLKTAARKTMKLEFWTEGC